MSKKIIVNATALRTGGALTILRQFIEAVPNDFYKYLIFIDDSIVIDNVPSNVQIISMDKRSFIKRFIWDAWGLKNWLKQHMIEPEMGISLQNTNFRLNKPCPNYIYYHQPLPLLPFKWNFFRKRERILWFYKNIYPFFVKLFINSQTCVFVQLDYIKDLFSFKYNFPENKIYVIFPEITIIRKKENKAKTELIDRNKLNLFYPATFLIYKNHNILFQAFLLIDKMLVSKIVLYLTIEQDLKSIYQFENIEIISLGEIQHDDIYEWYTNVDALLFPSYIETLGLPLIEAASFGLPIITADLPYAQEVLSGYNGVTYVNYKDAAVWADKILKLTDKPKMRHAPLLIKNKSSWNDLFQIIKKQL
jgi:glycosyltransferase involved in cell wall biosynthesis